MENTVTNILPHTSRTIYTTCTPRARERKRFSLGITSEPPDNDNGDDPIDILNGNLVILLYFTNKNNCAFPIIFMVK